MPRVGYDNPCQSTSLLRSYRRYVSTSTKYLIYLLIILTLVVGVLWFVGGKKQEFQTQVTIPASPAQIFRFLHHPERLSKWSSEIVEFEMVGEPEQGLGARADLIIDDQGREVSVTQEVINFELDKMVALQRVNDWKRSTTIFRLDEQASGTEVTYRVKESRLGISRVLGLFANSGRQQRINEDILRLKKLVQSETTWSPDPLIPRSLQDQVDEQNNITTPTGSQQNQPEDAFSDQ